MPAADPVPSQGFAIQVVKGAVLVLGCVTLLYPTVLALLAVPIVQRQCVVCICVSLSFLAMFPSAQYTCTGSISLCSRNTISPRGMGYPVSPFYCSSRVNEHL